MLSTENTELITENKQLKETFHKDKETIEDLTVRVDKLTEVNKILKDDNDDVQVIRKNLIDALKTAEYMTHEAEHWREKYYNKGPGEALAELLGVKERPVIVID